MKRELLVSILAVILFLYGCSVAPAPQTAAPAAPSASESAQTTAVPPLEITLNELSAFNGKDGAKAYIAVDGVIYDVTDVPPWAGGIHQGKYQAGIDASDLIIKSPHGKKVLEKLTVVGKIK